MKGDYRFRCIMEKECETRSRKVSWSDGDLSYREILSSENIIIYEIR